MENGRRKFLQAGLAVAAMGGKFRRALAAVKDNSKLTTLGTNRAHAFPAATGSTGGTGNPPKLIEVKGWIQGVTRLGDERLMGWWTEGKSEKQESIDNPTIKQKALARTSTDNGLTWSEPQVLFQYPAGPGTYDAGVLLYDKKGAIHLFGLHYFGCGPGGFGNWESCRSPLYHVMSADGGKTWTPPQNCDFGYLYTGATNSVIQIKSGRILIPISYYSHRFTGKFVTKLSLSDDGGKTWRPSKGECVVDTGGQLLESGAAEPICIELRDGRVWMLMRTQGGYQYEAFSKDGGDTWTEPVPSRFVSSNSPGSFLRLRDGRIVFVWNNCMGPEHEDGIMSSYDRQLLAAAVSQDDGKTWQGYREILRIRKGEWQVSYPWLTEAADGTIICSTLAGRGYFPQGVVRFHPNWLTETTLTEDFSQGLTNWVTFGCEGAEIIPHPERSGSKVLAFRKPKADVPAGASMNFPFGVRGRAKLRLRRQANIQAERQHYYFCLTDFFCLPRLPYFHADRWGGWGLYPSGERFAFRLAPDGELEVATRPGLFQTEYRRTKTILKTDKWYTLDLGWNCKKGLCSIEVDGRPVADLAQISPALGLCYLRLWASAKITDYSGILLESVDVRVEA